MRRAAATDGNQGVIVKALRSVGALVTPTHMVGNGFPDLVVLFRQDWHLIEVKDPTQPLNKRKLTSAEMDWHLAHGGKAHIVWTPVEALLAIGAMKWKSQCDCAGDEPHVAPCPEARRA